MLRTCFFYVENHMGYGFYIPPTGLWTCGPEAILVKKEKKKMDENREIWNKCADFHGHVCGGLTIGYKASLYAIELLGLASSEDMDEEVVCISENDACGVDAIQVILGCSVGKGNLLFHMTGKQAFNFYERKSGKSVRLVLKKKPEGMTRDQSFLYYQSLEPCDMFEVKETRIQLPEPAYIFDSYECECCGETAGANWIRIQGNKKLCLDCAVEYDRFRM